MNRIPRNSLRILLPFLFWQALLNFCFNPFCQFVRGRTRIKNLFLWSCLTRNLLGHFRERQFYKNRKEKDDLADIKRRQTTHKKAQIFSSDIGVCLGFKIWGWTPTPRFDKSSFNQKVKHFLKIQPLKKFFFFFCLSQHPMAIVFSK